MKEEVYKRLRQGLERKHFGDAGISVSQRKLDLIWNWAENTTSVWSDSEESEINGIKDAYAELAELVKPDESGQ